MAFSNELEILAKNFQGISDWQMKKRRILPFKKRREPGRCIEMIDFLQSNKPGDGNGFTGDSVPTMIDQAMRQLSPLTHTANMGIYANAMSPFHLPYRRQSQSRNPHLLHLINQTYHTGHAQGIEGFQSPLKIFHLICFKLEWQLASDTKHEHNRAASDICGAKVFLTGSYLPTFKLFDALNPPLSLCIRSLWALV